MIRRSLAPRPLAPRRWTALLLGLVVVLAHGLSTWHAGAELHRFCAEHGTIEHVSTRAADGEHAHDAAAHDHAEPDGLVLVPATEGVDDEHAACELGTFRRDEVAVDVADAQGPAVPASVALARVGGPSERRSSIDLVLLAPGHSPPV